jgi:hypothetical protein
VPESILNNPVRVMAVITSVVALVAFYLPTLPVALILAIPAAILGVGEVTRSNVTPTRNVVLTEEDLREVWGDDEEWE